MHPAFSEFETALERVARRLPQLPRQDVTLTRLYFFAFRALNEDLNGTLAPYGLNTNSMLALTMLYASPHQSAHPSSLSLGLIASRTNITRLVDELVDFGLVQRQACAGDRRKIVVTLTAEGVALVERTLPVQWQRMRAIWSALSAGEAALLGELLQKLWGRLHELERDT